VAWPTPTSQLARTSASLANPLTSSALKKENAQLVAMEMTTLVKVRTSV